MDTLTQDLEARLARLSEASRREIERLVLTPQVFRLAYRRDPLAFVQDCFTWPEDETPAPYQADLLGALLEQRRVAVRAPHGTGKSAVGSWLLLWFALTRDGATDWKIAVTASAWRQLTHFFWPEVHKWAGRLRWDLIGRRPFRISEELLDTALRLQTGEAFAMASDDPSQMEGAHASSLLVIFDEAKAIIPATWDAIEGAFSGARTNEAYAFAISTPGAPSGRFYEIHARTGFEDWAVAHVTLQEGIQAGRVNAEWAEQRARQWGISSPVYRNRVLGEFAEDSTDGTIPLSWVEAANERWREWYAKTGGVVEGPLTTVGVDVSDGGDDDTVLALRQGDVITELRRYSGEDTMATTGRVTGVLQGHGGRAIVDGIGIGAGVVARLRELGQKVSPFIASASTDLKDRSGELKFANLRAAGWWLLRERLDPAFGATLALPPDDRLTGDLVSPRWRPISGGTILLEPKDDLRKRLGRSPDSADATMMSLSDQLVAKEHAGPLAW